MIIPAQTLRQIKPLTPFHERTRVNGLTYGLGPAGYDIRVAETVMLAPGAFILASSVECFDMPLDLLGQVCDKSTWARRGIAVQNTIIEPGWRGFLTLEISNHHISKMLIRSGDPIAQVIFYRLEAATDQPYEGKYQDQVSGPQPAKSDDR